MNFTRALNRCAAAVLGACICLAPAFDPIAAKPSSAAQRFQESQPARTPSTDIETLESRSVGLIIPTPEDAVRYRLAGGGFVGRTVDGGATWLGQQVSSSARLIAGSAPSVKVCWVVGRDGAIYVTKNGIDWNKVNSPAALDFVAVTASDASAATVTSADGQKFATTNRGKSWHTVH